MFYQSEKATECFSNRLAPPPNLSVLTQWELNSSSGPVRLVTAQGTKCKEAPTLRVRKHRVLLILAVRHASTEGPVHYCLTRMRLTEASSQHILPWPLEQWDQNMANRTLALKASTRKWHVSLRLHFIGQRKSPALTSKRTEKCHLTMYLENRELEVLGAHSEWFP